MHEGDNQKRLDSIIKSMIEKGTDESDLAAAYEKLGFDILANDASKRATKLLDIAHALESPPAEKD